MRIHISTSPNTELVPYAYQQRLVGAFHKWLGTENPEHGDISLYSLSWLKGGKGQKKGLQYPNGAQWNISSPKPELLEKVIHGIQEDPAIASLSAGKKIRRFSGTRKITDRKGCCFIRTTKPSNQSLKSYINIIWQFERPRVKDIRSIKI